MPKARDTIALIDGAAESAKSTAMTVDAFKATFGYTATGLPVNLSAS
ncbi:hypothetical protein [Burkholderia cenocepacia]|nr:hypothetical protein [Burkholderia cenocepacia]